MTMLGAESFNGPLNQADLNAKGYWAGPNSVTGAGVAYGNPFQYRSLMRESQNSLTTFPYATTSGNDSYPGLINLGLVQDLYSKGGFWVGVTASYVGSQPQNSVASSGTKIVGLNNTLVQGLNLATDYINWQDVTNTVTSPGYSVSTVRTPLHYSDGAYYVGAQGSDSSFFWGRATDIPGEFVMTRLQNAANSFMNNLQAFRPMSVGGLAYYGGGYVSSPSLMSRIVRSASGAENTWSAVFTGTGTGQIFRLYEFGDAMYATEYSTISGSARGRILRSTDGLTWNVVYTSSAIGSSTCVYMAWDGNQTLVAVGNGGQAASSTDNGVTWTARTSGVPIADNIGCITWTGSEFTGITDKHNTVITSDGVTWQHKIVNIGSRSLAYMYIVEVGSEILMYTSQGYEYGMRWNPTAKIWSVIRACNATYNNNAASTPPTGVFFGTPTGGANTTIGGSRSMFGFSLLTDGTWSVGNDGTGSWGTKREQMGGTPTFVAGKTQRLELEYVAVPDQSVPTFDVYWYLDGSRSSAPVRATAAIGQSVFFTFAGMGHNVWYDFVYGDKSGSRNNAPLGNVRLLKKVLNTDVQADWERMPADLSSNAIAAQGNGSVSQNASSVQSTTPGQLDEYSGGMPSVPAGYRIAGIKLESMAQKVGLTNPTVRLGLIDNGAELPQVEAVLGSAPPVLLRNIYESDNAGQAWSQASATDALVSVENPTFGPDEDPYWSAVALLAKFNGAQGSTSVVDSSGKTSLACINNAFQGSGQVKYYPTSLDLTAAPTGVQIQLNQNFIWGTDDYTVETWLYPTSDAAGIIFFPSRPSIGNYFYFTRMAGGAVRMLAYRNSALATLGTTTNTIAIGAWAHFAAVRRSGSVSLYINGVPGVTISDTFNYNTIDSTGFIGVQNAAGGSPMIGYMSEFRVTRGVARYTGAFTPPTAALPDH